MTSNLVSLTNIGYSDYFSFKVTMVIPKVVNHIVKGALDKYIIIPNFFPPKSWDFYTIRSVGISNDCRLTFTF